MDLHGKLVLVTGAGSGIGRATALAFAAAGARVIAADRDAARVEAVGAELGGALFAAHTVDVADRAAMIAFADAVHAKAEAVDVLVNNAGVAVGGPFLDTSLDDWDWQLGVNLRGVVHGCHLFAPRMVARGRGGHVLNVSSVLGLYGAPGVSAYAASKFAVLGMSMSLRAELAPKGVAVTAICPGLIATAIVEDGRMRGETGARRGKLAHVFASRGLPPARVAEAMLEAVRRNPAVLPVGRDAWAIYAMSRVAPGALSRLGGSLGQRFGV